MTDMSSSIRMSASTRIYLYVSLSLIAAIVLRKRPAATA